MTKQPVEVRRELARQDFLKVLDKCIQNGYYAEVKFVTENGIICNLVEVTKKEKLNAEA